MSDIQTVNVDTKTNNVSRETVSATIDRQIAASSPASVGLMQGMLAATCDTRLVETAGGDVRQSPKRSPWNRASAWPPAEGEPIVVSAELNGVSSDRFYGVVDDSYGSAKSMQVSVAGVDRLDRLRRQLVVEPVANPMPMQNGLTSNAYIVNPQIRHEWFVEQALRAGGYYLVDTPTNPAALHVPMVGGLLPASNHYLTNTPGEGSWEPAPWGMGFRMQPGGTPEYTWPFTSNLRNTEISFNIKRQEDTAGYYARFGYTNSREGFPAANAGSVQVYLTGASSIRVRVRETGTSSPIVLDHFVTWSGYGEWLNVAVRRTTTQVRIYFDGVVVASADFATPAATRSVFAMGRDAGSGFDAPVIGNLVVGSPAQVGTRQAANAHLHTGSILQSEMVASERWSGSALDLLNEISQATGSSMWIDRLGQLHWAHPDAFDDRPASQVIDSTADLIDLSWRQSIQDTFNRVRVRNRGAALEMSKRSTVTIWSGAGDDIDTRDLRTPNGTDFRVEEIATPAPDETWFANRAPTNRPITSASSQMVTDTNMATNWFGATIFYGNAGYPLVGQDGSVTGSIDEITSQAYLVTSRINRASGTSDYLAVRFPPNYFLNNSATVKALHHNGEPLPILRGFGKISWQDPVLHTSTYSGPLAASEYVHEAGYWLDNSDSQRLANWMGLQTYRSRPLLDRLPIIPNHDLDLGQVIEVKEDVVYNVRLRALVVGIHERYSKGAASMELSLRVLGRIT